VLARIRTAPATATALALVLVLLGASLQSARRSSPSGLATAARVAPRKPVRVVPVEEPPARETATRRVRRKPVPIVPPEEPPAHELTYQEARQKAVQDAISYREFRTRYIKDYVARGGRDCMGVCCGLANTRIAPNVEMPMPAVDGPLPTVAFERVLLTLGAQIQTCVEREQLEPPWPDHSLGFELDIAASGVITSKIANAFDEAVARCVENVLLAAPLPRPKQGRVWVWTRFEIVEPRADHPGRGGPRRVSVIATCGASCVRGGDLDRLIIQRYVHRNVEKITSCYEDELSLPPDLAGTVVVQFFIQPSGTVSTSQGSGLDPKVSSCVAAVVHAIEFPRPEGGRGIVVNYPFTFHPAQPERLVTSSAASL
jgi:hypothetical protein